MLHKLYPNGVKTFIVVKDGVKCESCGKDLNIKDTTYKDCYRGDCFCEYCIEDYEESILSTEGEDGRLLK